MITFMIYLTEQQEKSFVVAEYRLEWKQIDTLGWHCISKWIFISTRFTDNHINRKHLLTWLEMIWPLCNNFFKKFLLENCSIKTMTEFLKTVQIYFKRYPTCIWWLKRLAIVCECWLGVVEAILWPLVCRIIFSSSWTTHEQAYSVKSHHQPCIWSYLGSVAFHCEHISLSWIYFANHIDDIIIIRPIRY